MSKIKYYINAVGVKNIKEFCRLNKIPYSSFFSAQQQAKKRRKNSFFVNGFCVVKNK